MIGLKSKPELKRSLYCLAHANGDLALICSPFEPIVLSSASELLRRLLLLLDGSQTVSELAAELVRQGSSCSETEVLEKLNELDSRLLLEDRCGEPEREKLCISLYYYEGLTLKEIGKVLGVGEPRVSQILSQTIIKLRSKMAEWEGTRNN